ncbi:monothiol glutaredoxin-S1-like [Amaranthus tricolor]|uniref:monothiol glutaredoxin-S1-like n=1 Tax=Amaranthus tricolor TaxID=29722 RepID=UPI0025851E62|nr:monothiol glutaredoxin-S1-like [Amaranthus tricolor]
MDRVYHLVEEKAVVIFSRSSCCMSHSMKQLISSYGANPTVYELDQTPNGDEIDMALQILGQSPSIPALFIGQRYIGGAKELITLQVQGKLVPLLREAKAIWV